MCPTLACEGAPCIRTTNRKPDNGGYGIPRRRSQQKQTEGQAWASPASAGSLAQDAGTRLRLCHKGKAWGEACCSTSIRRHRCCGHRAVGTVSRDCGTRAASPTGHTVRRGHPTSDVFIYRNPPTSRTEMLKKHKYQSEIWSGLWKKNKTKPQATNGRK